MQDIRRTSPDGGVPPVRNSALDSDRQKTASVSRARFFSGYTRLRTLESFQHRDFGVLWAVMFCMSISGWIINIVMGWLTYELTSSPLLTGLAIGMGAVPPVIIAPIAGVLIDSLDRKKVMIAAMGSFALFIGLFGVIVILGILQPWHIFAVSFLMGVSGSFLLPAEQAILANVVPKRRLVNAFALVAFAGSVTRLIAPAVTGFLIALIGPGACIMLACAFVLVGIKLTFQVRVAERERQPIRPKTVVTDLREAGRYVKGSQVVLAMMVLTTAMLTFVSTINMGLMPVFASDVFEAGPQVLGLLVAALGGGMTIGTIAIATVGDSRRRGRIVLITGTITALGVMAFSHSGTLLLAFPIIMLYGMTMVMTWTVASALIQSVVPDALRGRIAALSVMTHAFFPLGTLLVGGLAQLFGAPMATLISGMSILAVVLAIPVVFRSVWSYRAGDSLDMDEEATNNSSLDSPENLEPQPA